MVDISKIYDNTMKHFTKAYQSITIEKRALNEQFSAISDTVPGYKADVMNFGTYEKDNFAVLFIDMRQSTQRAISIGIEKTFLTMHAYIPAMLEVIKYYNGVVIDIMGDGIMVFFGGKRSKLVKNTAIQNAGLCGKAMLEVKDEVTNRILRENNIQWPISCGVGVDYGDVIVTKIGINDLFDVKAYGDCVNKASKYSNGIDIVKVSKVVHDNWPSSKGGRIQFKNSDDGYILSRK